MVTCIYVCKWHRDVIVNSFAIFFQKLKFFCISLAVSFSYFKFMRDQYDYDYKSKLSNEWKQYVLSPTEKKVHNKKSLKSEKTQGENVIFGWNRYLWREK